MFHKNFAVMPAVVKSVNIESRLLNVKFLGTERSANNVVLVDSFSNYSFPNVGDTVLVLLVDEREYAIGKIESRFYDQIQGKIKDPVTKTTLLPKKVAAGAAFISNIIKSINLSLDNSGDFSLSNLWKDGLVYTISKRFTEIIGNTIHLEALSKNVTAKIGAVLRDIPSQGKTIISKNSLPALEVGFTILNNTIDFVRLQLGHVIDDLGSEETSTFGNNLRAVLEVCSTLGIQVATINIDENGNIEVKSVDNDIVIDANDTGNIEIKTQTGQITFTSNTTDGVLLSGSGSSQSAVRGEKLLDWLKLHTHNTAVGPSSNPTTDPTLAVFNILSSQVKLD